MNGKRTNWIGGVWIALALAACAQGDPLPVPLEVSAEIGQGVTRAGGDAYATDYDKRTFATGDRIEISKYVTAESALYQRKAEGGWGLADGQTALTTTGSESFAASFPEEFSGILADQSTPTNFWKSNRLTAAGVLNGNKCSFTFAPAAAKVTVVVTYQSSQTPESASLSGTGIRTDAGASETITPYCASGSTTTSVRHTYVAIVCPGLRQFTIKLKTTTELEKTYTDASPFTLQAGYNYQYNFTATNELILTGVTVVPFSDEPEENVGSAT